MGSQLARSKKGSSENVDKNIALKINKGKKTKHGDDGASVSSLDMAPAFDSDLVASRAYDPPINAYESAISVRKGDSLWMYGKSPTGEWFDVLCRRTGERGWVPASCVIVSSMPLVTSATVASVGIHASCPSLIGERWYHGAIHRSYAEYLLNSGITGSFLVRESESSFGKLTLSLRSDGRIFHYRICVDEDNQCYINEARRFATVSELVQHHEKVADGLACPLLYGVSKRDELNRGGIDSDYDAWEINRTDVIMKHKLGSGQYGVVYEAILKPYDVTVAVKTLKEDITLRDEFLQEARLMKSLRHPNLVRLLGVCTQEPPYYIITEFMCNGNLLDYLRTQPRDVISPPVLLQMAIHVCCAMTYLEEHSFIHRDLAARNCLVSEEMIVKVADFGLARYMECDVTYRAREGAKFPIKWTAPEGLVYNCFSTKSDVWAFGVLLWEIASFGATPYPGVELQDVYILLEKGTRMEAPQGCPDPVYQLMLDCWSWNSEERPSFKEVYARLETIRTSSDINKAVEHELQRRRIRMLPPLLPPPSFTALSDETLRRSSSCDRIDECIPYDSRSPASAIAKVGRRWHTESFTDKDVIAKRVGTGDQFSPVLSSCPLPPPPSLPIPHSDNAVDNADTGISDVEVGAAVSFPQKKTAPPTPPLRTTTLRGDESFEKAASGVQVSVDDRQTFTRIGVEHLSSPPNTVLCNTNWSSPQSQNSPPLNSDLLVAMTSSATFGSPSLSANSRRTGIPVPPQRSESSRSQNVPLNKGDFKKSSPKKDLLSTTYSSPNNPTPINNSSGKNIDFHSELSSRLKRQLDCSSSTDSLSRLPTSPCVATTAVTADMIQSSKSKLKAATTVITTSSEIQSIPVVPAWKELVIQRQRKRIESAAGKRMSWTPTSNPNSSSLFKHHYQQQQFTNVESFSEIVEKEEDCGEEIEGGDLVAIMSQSMTNAKASDVASTSSFENRLSYEQLLKQVTGLCADLNLAKANLPNDHNSALVDRIEEFKQACLSYVNEMDCSAHAKFRFRDECAKIQTAADTVRAICGAGAKVTELGGRRKAFHAVYTTMETIQKSLLRLTPSSMNSGAGESAPSSAANGFVGTGVIS